MGSSSCWHCLELVPTSTIGAGERQPADAPGATGRQDPVSLKARALLAESAMASPMEGAEESFSACHSPCPSSETAAHRARPPISQGCRWCPPYHKPGHQCPQAEFLTSQLRRHHKPGMGSPGVTALTLRVSGSLLSQLIPHKPGGRAPPGKGLQLRGATHHKALHDRAWVTSM